MEWHRPWVKKQSILSYGVGFWSQAQGVMGVIEEISWVWVVQEDDWIGLYVVTWRFNAACG